jgi:hypothetical protein
MSRRKARSICGRSTLTATSSPVSRQRALWTCAIEAAATGSEKAEKTSSTRTWPSSADHRLGDFGGKGRQLVLQVFQLRRQLVAHHVGAGREDLAELDVGRPRAVSARVTGGRSGRPLAQPGLNGQPSTRASTRSRGGALHRLQHLPIAPVRSKVASVRISRQMLWGPFT